jgi:hypothetical protein
VIWNTIYRSDRFVLDIYFDWKFFTMDAKVEIRQDWKNRGHPRTAEIWFLGDAFRDPLKSPHRSDEYNSRGFVATSPRCWREELIL